MMTRTPTPDVLDDVLGPAPTAPQWLSVEKIRSDGGTQMRAALNDEIVTEYVELMGVGFNDSGPFPPIIVFHDGSEYWLADGFHRVAAARIKEQRLKIIMSLPADVRAGTRRDAILYAAGANSAHGLRRTNADKRRAVEAMLRDEEWSQWSNSEIARRCAVDEKTVRLARANVTSEIPKSTANLPAETTNGAPSPTALADPPAPILRRGADGRTINTANIGQRRQQARYAEVWELQHVVQLLADGLLADGVPPDIVAADLRKCASQREGETWGLAQRAVEADGLVHRVPDLMQAMTNVARNVERNVERSSVPAAQLPAVALAVRPDSIGLAAWERMDGTLMRENNRLLSDLAAYDGEQQVRIVEALAGGTVGTVASAVAMLKITPAAPEPETAASPEPTNSGNDANGQSTLITALTPAPTDAKAQRQVTLQRLLHVYQTACDELNQFAELTGHFTWVAPTRRALEPIVTTLQDELLPPEA